MEKAQGLRKGNPASNPFFPPDSSKLAVSLGFHVLISDMRCQQWPCILPSVAGRIRGREEEINMKWIRRAQFRVQSQGPDAPT